MDEKDLITDQEDISCVYLKMEKHTCRAGVEYEGVRKGDYCPFKLDYHSCAGFEYLKIWNGTVLFQTYGEE